MHVLVLKKLWEVHHYMYLKKKKANAPFGEILEMLGRESLVCSEEPGKQFQQCLWFKESTWFQTKAALGSDRCAAGARVPTGVRTWSRGVNRLTS